MTEWKDDEYVDYDEFAPYGCTGRQRDKNYLNALKLGISEEDRCPFCEKPLKPGSYKILYVIRGDNGCERYYLSPNSGGRPIKVGNGCFKNLQRAYKEKYNKQ